MTPANENRESRPVPRVSKRPKRSRFPDASLIGISITLTSIMLVLVIGHFLDAFESKIELDLKSALFFGNILFGMFGFGLAITGMIRVGIAFAVFWLLVFALASGAGFLAGNYA